MAFNFKSAGNLPAIDSQLRRTEDPPKLSIKTPLELGMGASGLFEMHTNVGDAIRDNLRNLLLTNHGERLIHTDLGANLRPLLTELAAEGGDDIAKTTDDAVGLWTWTNPAANTSGTWF